MAYYNKARSRAKRSRNSWNLLQIPLVVGGVALVTWIFLQIILLIMSHLRGKPITLTSYRLEDIREFIVIPLAVAAMPLGMMLSNFVMWLILPLRKIQEEEVSGHEGGDFGSSMRGLGRFAAFSVPIGIGISLIVAAFGR